MSTFEKVAASLIIVFGLILGWGILSLGQHIIDVKQQNYELKLQLKSYMPADGGSY